VDPSTEDALQHVEVIRELSWALFRRNYALEIGAVISQLDLFTVAEVTQRLRAPPSPSSIQKELSDLRRVHLLHEAPKRRSERQKFYRKTSCAYWNACVDLADKARTGDLG
jgi:hypothetical protein